MMTVPSLCGRRLSRSDVTLGFAPQTALNSGRWVISSMTGSEGTASISAPSTSELDGSIQCTSSNRIRMDASFDNASSSPTSALMVPDLRSSGLAASSG